ncbi:3-oxoadipate enol-lactonase [Pigmentiphaga soli]|uniref:3-oxoadipate enol-lactonase n=1 Tax=Pigmentiphaga soli TaxID=1007095 RepID=A0ABP8GGX6_9BURK
MSCPSLAATLEPMPGRLVDTGGPRLYVTDNGQPGGPPLVFFHGLGWTHALWRRQAARYGDRYRIIAGDTRGHGLSDKPPGPYTIAGMAEDWIRALDALGVEQWCLVGFSQGGRIAQQIAVTAPERTRALVVIGSGCRDNPASRARMEQRLEAARQSTRHAAEVAAASIFSPAFIEREAGFVTRFIEQRAALDFTPLAAATLALLSFDVKADLARVGCPALVAVAGQDQLCSVPTATEVAEALPHATLRTIPGSGHMVTLEQPAAVDALLDDFLHTHYH